MKKVLIISIVIIAAITTTVLSIGPMKIGIWFLKPAHSFDDQVQAPTPNYSEITNWAALPQIEDPSDFRPQGVLVDSNLADIDVFFIHPTGYLNGARWNSDMDMNTGTEENTKWMMANQASVFSDCQVYAPRYREATIFSFFDVDGQDELSALDFAYADVERAFDYFIENYNMGRPFILASHSQGSRHALTLMKSRIDQSDLKNRMVAAYVIGINNMTDANVAELKNIPVCDSPDQTGCLIHWATFSEDVDYEEVVSVEKAVCVNPITWKRDGGRAEKALHQGYVNQSGSYNANFRGADKALGVNFQPLDGPNFAYTCATCIEGRLLVENQPNMTMEMGEGNYHGLDFQLFHMDIRQNVSARVRAFKQSKEGVATVLENARY